MITPEKVRRDIVEVMSYRHTRGPTRHPYWFAVVEDPYYPSAADPVIRLVTLAESMPLTRGMVADIAHGPAHCYLFGRYLVADILDDTPPQAFGPPEDEVVRAIELVLVLHPGPGMTASAAVGSLSLGLPGGCMSETLILAATDRPQGWPP